MKKPPVTAKKTRPRTSFAFAQRRRAQDAPRFESVPVKVKWTPSDLKPKVLIAQLRATYLDGAVGDTRIRHAATADYDRKLLTVLELSINQGAQFVVFPEYAWPFRMLETVHQLANQKLPAGTAWLVPFEHLRLEEFEALLKTFPVPQHLRARSTLDVENAVRARDRSSSYVNVCVTLLRTDAGLVAIPQTKARPAGLETDLVGGRSVYIIEGQECCFCSFLCFDWIARDESSAERPRDALTGTRPVPDVVFVPECNPSPLHPAYARSIIDLFEAPAVAPRVPYLVFSNVASGSRLPQLPSVSRFGFSRIIGRLGESRAQTNVAVVQNGLFAHEEAARLQELTDAPHRMPIPTVASLTARPEESVIVVQLPLLRSGPSRDPTAGRANTMVDGFRWADGWQRIRTPIRLPRTRKHFGVPAELLSAEGLVGAAGIEATFEKLLRESHLPVCVTGQGGSGKTAIVAAVLARIERQGTARVLWVDLAEIEGDSTVLREHLVLHLGLSGGLRESAAQQWQMICTALQRAATVIVLDSREYWHHELPSELTALHSWPTRIVITSRQSPTRSDDFKLLNVPPLASESAADLMRRTSEGAIDQAALQTFAALSGGSPLACLWLGSALPRSESSLLAAAQAGQDSDEGPLGSVFSALTNNLTASEREVLAALSWLPHAVSDSDLSDICGRELARVRSDIAELRRQRLVLPDPTGAGTVHTAHPFVHQFVKTWGERGAVQEKVISWATRVLSKSGGDRNWNEYKSLAARWPNVRSVLGVLAQERPADFVSLWRQCDYFLWSSGRRGERVRWGERAAEIAREVGAPELRAHALYDAIAESKWHSAGGEQECSDLLDEAEKVAREIANPNEHLAMIEYYRSRLARRFNHADESSAAAARAMSLAVASKNPHTVGLCENALGNALLSKRLYDEALQHFDRATTAFDECSDPEMKAVARRNKGRCLTEMGRLGDAITELDAARTSLEKLELHVECAEVALYHAEALAKLGDHAEAHAEAEEVKQMLESLGALALLKRADAILSGGGAS